MRGNFFSQRVGGSVEFIATEGSGSQTEIDKFLIARGIKGYGERERERENGVEQPIGHGGVDSMGRMALLRLLCLMKFAVCEWLGEGVLPSRPEETSAELALTQPVIQ